MPEPLSRMPMPCSATAVASTCVGTILLSRNSCLRAGDHRCSAHAAPHRLMIASAPSNALSSIMPLGGSQRRSSGVTGGRRTSRSTSCPASRNAETSGVPITPDAPAITTRMVLSLGRLPLYRSSVCPSGTGSVPEVAPGPHCLRGLPVSGFSASVPVRGRLRRLTTFDSGCTAPCGRSATTSVARRHARPVPVPRNAHG